MGNAAIEPMPASGFSSEAVSVPSPAPASVPVEAKKSSKSPRPVVESIANTEEEDDSPVQILLQFIPYYGQGDPANDSLVRSTLSGLASEDIDSRDGEQNT